MATKKISTLVKKVVKKSAEKPAVAPVGKKSAEPKKTSTSNKGLVASVVDVTGTSAGTVTLPGELFGANVNKTLMAQAVRIYQANQRSGTASTKTRGQVEGSTRKIYKQKGTGKARHGGIRAPIFVGGGIVFGSTPRDYSLQFPKKMKSAALASTLTHVYQNGDIVFVDGLESLPAKTRDIAKSLTSLSAGSSVLLVIAHSATGVARASRNIEGVEIMDVLNMHPYALLSHKKIVFMKSAIAESKERFVNAL